MSARNPSGGENLLAMSVDDIGFLLDRLGQDCHRLQFLRELTQNSIEAIQRTGRPGGIVWDVDWNQFDLGDGVYKLCITDTGDGMTGEEMMRFINQLSSSVSEQSLSGNYGVGAKISAATRNHHGVVYCSWKDGNGAMIQLHRDPESRQYGLKQWDWSDGNCDHYLPIEDDIKPEGIAEHGTRVILLGNSQSQNTVQPPEDVPAPSRWISKYLNTRYFRFPKDVTLKSREGWEFPRSDTDRNYLRRLIGQEAYLNEHAEDSGSVSLREATAYWWILKDEKAIGNNSGHMESAGHIAALYHDELYEMASARSGMSRLQQFGITFGYKFVVIYVEPHESSAANVTTNTSRTSLLLNNESLPWDEWAIEFRENMPAPLAKLVEDKSAGSLASDHTKTIRDRLKELLGLYKVSRYKPSAAGAYFLDDDKIIHAGPSDEATKSTASTSRATGSTPSKARQKDGELGNIYSIFEKKGGTAARLVNSDPFPKTRWVCMKDETRVYGDIEDRAAKYLDDQNMLLVNADFRVFEDMVAHFVKEFGDQPGVHDAIVDAVRAWFEQALVETIMGVHSLRHSKEWSLKDIEAALSEEALTSSVMQRYHVVFAVKRHLGSLLGGKTKRTAG